MRNLLRLTFPLAVVLAAGLAAAEEKPQTLLGKWMQPNMGAPMSGGDFETLQKSLQLVADKPPPAAKKDYPNWAAMSKQGADAAGKQDINGVKKSCRNCHDTYREKYRKEQASRPFP